MIIVAEGTSSLTELRRRTMKPERSTYTPLDFVEWRETGKLILSPKFQRRGVWSTPARSYLIDTLLLGMPVPPIYLRVVQDNDTQQMIREVIDGQQRISAVLEYIQEAYALSSNIESAAKGKRFSALSREDQDQILHYPFICEVFYGIEDEQVLQIFARMNIHSVKLNAQELRNGRFFGPFKRSAYQLALEHLAFWRSHRIFTEQRIARMAEVELTSELMVQQLAGLQDKKSSIDDYYEEYDEDFPQRQTVEKRFRSVIDVLAESPGDILRQTEFRRAPLFYSLYGAVYHQLWGLPGEKLPSPKRGRISAAEADALTNAVRKLSGLITDAKAEEPIPRSYERFVNACLRQTDNIRPRRTRLETIFREAFAK